ncbi:hypothetical protein H5410_059438 [Solanum commersonii]|uniref:Uncharacterized protein n=1 Tax=Solanum commersonii TaxID=4109 RepID=A0A9J5W2W6_SOLCO|nr:hypothetical protein H5410_059438 [Solanum commersonii]
MDKVFDLDLALTVVGISGGDTAEPPAPQCFTPPDDHDVSIQVQLPSVNCENGLCISPPLDGGADSEVKFDQLDF